MATRQKTRPFKMVLGLWVTPDFSGVMAGRTKPPRINHSILDFASLRAALKEAFKYGPKVDIAVPNDTIDQVTLHGRAGMLGAIGMTGARDPQAIRCADFGQALLNCAADVKDGVVNVRSSWQALHARPVLDRDFAPPPSILPFLVLAEDFEDAQIWHASCRPVMGLPVFDPMKAVLGQDQGDNRESTLPRSLQQQLGEIFQSPFESPALLDRMAMDKPPPEFGLAGY